MGTASHTDRVAPARKLQGLLAARILDLGLAAQIAALSDGQRQAIIEWQKTARIYELIQRVARRRITLHQLPSEVARPVAQTMRDLNEAIEQSALPADLVLYRGIRNLKNTFGTQDAGELQGETHLDLGFVASSVHAEIAVRDFTTPKGALIAMNASKNTRALWVARAGHPQLSWQGEVLFGPKLEVRFCSIDSEQNLPLLLGEVMT